MTRVGDQRPRLSLLPECDSIEAGDEVIEFARRFGLELDDWQQWVVRHMCAERSDGSWAATKSTLLVPRQCGKSAILEAIEMASLFLWEDTHVIYSAHLGKTATDHMRRINRHMLSTPDFRRRARMLTGKGDERVETHDGRVLEFITRGKKTARGGSPNRVIFDEAMFLTDDQIQAMVPALAAQSMNDDGAAQMIYASSAPIAESQVLHRLRDAATKGSPSRTFFAEWSVPPDTDPADRDGWYQANPGLGVRISAEWIEDNEFGTLSDEAFAIERLGIPQEPLSESQIRPIPLTTWDSLIDATSTPDPKRCAIALDTNPERTWFTLSMAGERSDGLIHCEITKSHPGKASAIAMADDIAAKLDLPVVVSETSGLADDLINAVTMKSGEQALATSKLIDATRGEAPLVRHRGEPAMRRSIEMAQTKPYGDGGVVWSRRTTSGDISPLTALTMAFGFLGADVDQMPDPFVVFS